MAGAFKLKNTTQIKAALSRLYCLAFIAFVFTCGMRYKQEVVVQCCGMLPLSLGSFVVIRLVFAFFVLVSIEQHMRLLFLQRQVIFCWGSKRWSIPLAIRTPLTEE
jgi:Ca2+/H+ antiporter